MITILAVLVSLTLAGSGKYFTKANEVLALSNLRQLALGELMYVSEHDGMLSLAYGQGGELITWKNRIFPYVYPDVGSTTTLAKMVAAGPTVFDMPGATNRTTLSSVAMNEILCGSGGGWIRQQGVRLTAIPKPSRIILFAEMCEVSKDGVAPLNPGGVIGTPGTVAFRRDGGKTAGMAFLDGHVEKVSIAAQVNTGQKGENLWQW